MARENSAKKVFSAVSKRSGDALKATLSDAVTKVVTKHSKTTKEGSAVTAGKSGFKQILPSAALEQSEVSRLAAINTASEATARITSLYHNNAGQSLESLATAVGGYG